MKKFVLKFSVFIFSLQFFLFSASAAPVKASQVPSDFIIVKVNNKAITNSEVSDRYQFVVSASKISITSDQDQKLLLDQIIDKMIDEELIRQEALGLRLEATPVEVRDFIDMVALQQKKNATQFKLFFIKNNLSFDNYLKQIESEILWQKIMSEVLRSKVKVTDVEVKELFEQRKFSTDVKKYLIAEILISPSENSAKLASKLAEELKQGADFGNIVRQFSSGVTAETNGEIGWVSHADIDPKIYSAISHLTKGGYSDPVSLSDGHHIFKLLDSKTETTIADQDLNAARNIIFGRKLQSVAKGYLMDLRKKAFVEVKKG